MGRQSPSFLHAKVRDHIRVFIINFVFAYPDLKCIRPLCRYYIMDYYSGPRLHLSSMLHQSRRRRIFTMYFDQNRIKNSCGLLIKGRWLGRNSLRPKMDLISEGIAPFFWIHLIIAVWAPSGMAKRGLTWLLRKWWGSGMWSPALFLFRVWKIKGYYEWEEVEAGKE